MARHSRQDIRTFDAEETFAAAIGSPTLTQRRAIGLLARDLLPPSIFERLRVQDLRTATRGSRFTHGRTEVPPEGPITLELVWPTCAVVFTHEASHILLDVTSQDFTRPDHDDAFRLTHLWVVRKVFGLNRARLLGAAYTAEGLTWT